MFLRRADRSRNDLKYIRWRSAISILDSHRDSQDEFCAKLASGLRGYGGYQATVGEAARADFHWFKEAGKRAAGPNGVDEVAVRQHHRFTRVEVRGYHRHGYLQILKLFGIEDTGD